MKQYTVTRVAGSPDWQKIPEVQMDNTYLNTPDNVHSFAQLAYTDDCILVHLRAEVPCIRAEVTSPYKEPCVDSCLEFFFSPVPGDDRYFNIEFNFNGVVFLGFGRCVQELIRMYPEDGADNLLCPEIRATQTGWEIFYRIPYSFVRRIMPDAAILPGQEIRGNFYACSDLSEPAYYLSWSPVSGDPLTFHRSECFGAIKFENY